MMKRLLLLAAVSALVAVLAGCGGPEDAAAPPTPPPGGDDSAPVQVGPLMVRPASAAGFVAEEIPNWGPVSFVALYGSEIRWLSSQAMLDRIVYSSGPLGTLNLYICNLDGSGRVRLTNTTADDSSPAWSPNGRHVAFDRKRPAQDREVCMIGADGSDPHALTNNGAFDGHPTWSPEGSRIAFQTDRDTNMEVYVMYSDGAAQVNLTNHGLADTMPHWSPYASTPLIAFVSERDGNKEIYTMRDDGSVPTRLTTNSVMDQSPAVDPWGYEIAYESQVQGMWDIMAMPATGGNGRVVSGGSTHDQLPAWSSDRRFICYSSDADGDFELMLQETEPPYQRWQLTRNARWDVFADLGSPTMQTDRVIIGPAGSDWGGNNPIWSNAYGAIAAYAEDGYRNLVRIGIRAEDVASLDVGPLVRPAPFMGPGSEAVGVVVEAADIVNLREDGGRARPSVLWQLDPLDATAVLLYFHFETGKLLAALVLRDQTYPSGTGTPADAVTQRLAAGATIVEGEFAAVFDGTGARIADGAALVRIADGAVEAVR